MSIKDLFKVLLHELHGFKCQITLNVTLCKDKLGNTSEYASVYFNSFTKTITNHDFKHFIDKCFEEILFRIDNWVNKGSGWIVDRINGQYLNISKYSPLLGSSYIELPDRLSHPKKNLINIRNNDNKCFLWCHVRHLNLADSHSTRISREDREIANMLDYDGVNFPISEKDYSSIEDKNGININVFSYEGDNVYPIYISDKNYGGDMDLVLICLIMCTLKILTG